MYRVCKNTYVCAYNYLVLCAMCVVYVEVIVYNFISI